MLTGNCLAYSYPEDRSNIFHRNVSDADSVVERTTEIGANTLRMTLTRGTWKQN
jgi:hypothetical protein